MVRREPDPRRRGPCLLHLRHDRPLAVPASEAGADVNGIPADVQLRLIESWEEAEEFRSWLGERRSVLAIDTETDGFRWWDGTLRIVQFGDAHTGWAIPFDQWGYLVRESVERYEGPIAFHNAKFDIHWLERYGIKVPRHLVHDTQIMAHLIAPDQRTGLKECAARWIDVRAATGQENLKKAMARAKWSWGSIPVEFSDYWVYAALDPVLTARLWEFLIPQIRVDFHGIYDLEMAASHILMDMETRGIRVDLDYVVEQKEKLSDYAKQAREWCEEQYGFGIGSNRNVAARLLADGVTLTKRTPSGAWKMDEDVLSGIEHPLAETVLAVRKAEKIANSYFGKLIELADGDIVHCSVRPLGARTGRMSVADPSMQNLPRGPMVRNAFIAREGHTLVGADMDQIELRLAAHFSQDPGLIAAFDSDDVFTDMARRIYGDDTITKDDERRQYTKNGMYGFIYGTGAETFANTVGISEAEGRKFLTTLQDSFPGLRSFSQSIQSDARRRGMTEGTEYVLTEMGRRLVAPDMRIYALVNAKIQGTAADLLKQAIVELDATGAGQYLALPIHDELVLDVPEEEAEEVAVELVRVMTRDDFAVPLTAGSNIAKRLGELK